MTAKDYLILRRNHNGVEQHLFASQLIEAPLAAPPVAKALFRNNLPQGHHVVLAKLEVCSVHKNGHWLPDDAKCEPKDNISNR